MGWVYSIHLMTKMVDSWRLAAVHFWWHRLCSKAGTVSCCVCCRHSDGKDLYLVRWKGYAEPSWEPDENIGSELATLKRAARERAGGEGEGRKRKKKKDGDGEEKQKKEKKKDKKKRRRGSSDGKKKAKDSSDSDRDEIPMPMPGMMPMPPMPGMMPPMPFPPMDGKGKGLPPMMPGKGMPPPGFGKGMPPPMPPFGPPVGPPPWFDPAKGFPGKGPGFQSGIPKSNVFVSSLHFIYWFWMSSKLHFIKASYIICIYIYIYHF